MVGGPTQGVGWASAGLWGLARPKKGDSHPTPKQAFPQSKSVPLHASRQPKSSYVRSLGPPRGPRPPHASRRSITSRDVDCHRAQVERARPFWRSSATRCALSSCGGVRV